MPITPSQLDYTDKDFVSIKARLEKLAHSAFPTWTDFTIAAFGNFNIEMFSHVGDVLGFYLDAQAGETRWSTAQQKKNVLSLVKLINYQPKTATAGKVTATLTLAAPPVGNVEFVADTIIKTASNPQVRFALIQDYEILAGADPPTIEVVGANWITRNESFAPSGKPNQAVILGSSPFLIEGLLVTDAQGDYTVVDSFLDSKSTDRHLTYTVDSNQRATLRFGNGTLGVLPVGTINVEYHTGGGAVGKVAVGTVTQIEGSFTDSFNNPVTVSVTNAAESIDAAEAESTAQIKENAPKSLRAVRTTVSREDFEIHAVEVNGVSRALMMTSNEDIAIPENAGRLYIIPTGGGMPTQDLKNAVYTMVKTTKPCTLTFNVGVYDPVYTTVTIFARVYLQNGVTNTAAKAAIQAALTAWFALTNPDGSTNTQVNFGFNYKDVNGEPTNELALSTLMKVVETTTGVRKIGDVSSDFLVNSKHADLAIAGNAFPILGTVTLVNGDTGNVM